MARHGDQACRRHAANGSLRFPAAYPFGTEVPGGSGKGAPHSLQWVSPSSFCAPQDRHVPQWDEGNARGGSTAAAALLGNSFASPCFIGTIAMASASFFPSASLHVDAALSTFAHSVASSDAAFNLPSSGERLLRSQDAGGDSIHAIESRSSRKRDAKGAGRTPHPRHREQALLQAGRPDHSPNNDFRRKRSARRRTASWALHERSPRRGNRGDGRFAAGR